MIDATFLLLCYFIFTTAAGRPEDRLSPQLGGSRGGGASDLAPQIVEVRRDAEGDLFTIGTRNFRQRDRLAEALRELPREPGLFVRVHPGPPVSAAAAAMQAAADAGFERVTYVPGEPGG